MLTPGAGSFDTDDTPAPHAPDEPLRVDEVDRLLSPLSRFGRIVLAVSGGPDSLALMVLADAWARRLPRAPEIVVATVDHGLRPEARAEAEAVGALCARLGRPHRILSWQGAKPKSNLQDAARRARYRLLRDLARDLDAGAIVTAHHRDDQAETFLLALARGSGVRGLAAMAPRRDLDGVCLIRPLIGIPKARLVATVEARGLAYASDPSNESERYARARVRKASRLLAGLGLTPERLAATAAAMARADAALEAQERDLIRRCCTARFAGLTFECDAHGLFDAPEEIRLRALSRLIRVIGGADHGPRFERLERLAAALWSGLDQDDGLRRTLGGVQIVLAPRGQGPHGASRRLWLGLESGRAGLGRLALAPGEDGIWAGRYHIVAAPTAPGPVEIREIGVAGAAELLRRMRAHGTIAPRGILAVLPGIFVDNELLGAPGLEAENGLDARYSAITITPLDRPSPGHAQ